MLDPDELAWLDEQLRGDVDHLLVGTSLPFLLARGLHHLEAFSEALARARGASAAAGAGSGCASASTSSTGRRSRSGFPRWPEMAIEVASGERGRAPVTVTFLSGDVHHSYVSEARPADPATDAALEPILQAVCSPIRNPLSRNMRFATAVLSLRRRRDRSGAWRPARPRCLTRRSRGSTPRGRGSTTTWRSSSWHGRACGCGGSPARWSTDHERPRLTKVASYELDEQGRPPAPDRVVDRLGRGLRRRVRDKVQERVKQR